MTGCRNYLLLVANRSLSEDMQAKLGASDLVQETFAQAQQIFDRFQGHTEEELLAWLARILEYKLTYATRQFRHTEKRDVAREVLLAGGDPGSRPVAPVAACCQSPSDVAIRGEEVERLERARSTLNEDQRRVIILRTWEGYSFEQVGEQMSRSADAARKLWARAVIQLQRKLKAESHGSEFC